jgi:hypothetical protein
MQRLRVPGKTAFLAAAFYAAKLAHSHQYHWGMTVL